MLMAKRHREGRGHSVRRRVGAALAAVLLVASSVLNVVALAPRKAEATVPDSITVATVSAYPSGQMDGDGLNSHMFTDPSGTTLYCADCDAGTPVPGQTFTGRVAGGLVLDYILWYGHGGTGDAGWSQAATQCAVWEQMNQTGNGLNASGYHRLKQAWPEAKRLYDEAVANASETGPYAGTTWIYGEASKACQRMIGQTARTGSITIEKASANPSLSDGNASYSLEGAVFGVYSDAACANEVTRMTTDASGRASASDLALGTYWVRELSAPHGYAPSEEIYEASVGVVGVTVRVGELPQNDPLLLSLAKVDADSGEGSAQGGATLAGAEFTVRYYAGTYDAVDALPTEPTRTWVLKTDTGGQTSLANAQKDPATYYVGGDAFYTSSDGTATIPLGTVAVQETKAPTGYLLDSTVHLRQVNASGTAEHVSSEALPTVTEQVIRGGVRVQKVDFETGQNIAQGDASLAGTEVTIRNVSGKAVWVGGARYDDGADVLTLTLDASGYAESAPDALPFGTYEARESAVPEGYAPNERWRETFSVQQDGIVVALKTQLPDEVLRGGVSVPKLDRDLMAGTAQGDATLAGAELSVTNRSASAVYVDGVLYQPGDVVATITTNEGGVAASSADTLPYGTYELKETKAPEGYLVNEDWSQTFEVRQDGTVVNLASSAVDDAVARGGVRVRKTDAEWGTSSPQGDATLAGAEFQITNESARDVVVSGEKYAPGQVVATITTDESGAAATDGDALPFGTYSIRESDAPEGYLVNKEWSRTFEVRADGAVTDLTADADRTDDQVIRGGVSLRKVDRELVESQPLGGTTLEDATIEITNESTHAVRVNGTDIEPGSVVATFATDESGCASTAADALPYGTYRAREVQPPKGYLVNEDWSPTFQIRESGVIVDLTGSDQAVADQAIRGDLNLTKAEEGSQNRMARIPFSLTSLTTGESHVLVTDENGMLDTSSGWNSHAQDTNANDAALREDGTVDDVALNPAAGIWFSGRADRETTPDDTLGALPFDTYDLAELPCAANEGHRLVSTRVTITRHAVNLDLGTMDDEEIPVPEIGTELMYVGGKAVPADSQTTLTDKVSYQGLLPSETYTLEGELHLVSEDEDGQLTDEGVVSTASSEFSPVLSEGSTGMTFELDTTGMAGKRLVAFETLRDKDGTIVAEHKDLADEGQTVSVPSLVSELTADGSHEATTPDGTARLTERLSFAGLEPGITYMASSELHWRGTDESGSAVDLGPVTALDGTTVSAQASFVPTEASGTVELTYEFDGIELEGKTVVALSYVTRDGLLMACHADVAAEEQAVSFVERPEEPEEPEEPVTPEEPTPEPEPEPEPDPTPELTPEPEPMPNPEPEPEPGPEPTPEPAPEPEPQPEPAPEPEPPLPYTGEAASPALAALSAGVGAAALGSLAYLRSQRAHRLPRTPRKKRN